MIGSAGSGLASILACLSPTAPATESASAASILPSLRGSGKAAARPCRVCDAFTCVEYRFRESLPRAISCREDAQDRTIGGRQLLVAAEWRCEDDVASGVAGDAPSPRPKSAEQMARGCCARSLETFINICELSPTAAFSLASQQVCSYSTGDSGPERKEERRRYSASSHSGRTGSMSDKNPPLRVS